MSLLFPTKGINADVRITAVARSLKNPNNRPSPVIEKFLQVRSQTQPVTLLQNAKLDARHFWGLAT